MKIHELTVTPTKSRKRIGRGISAGQGKTAGRGTKGQNSRTGGGVRPGFEGGQNPWAKRIPKKRGFTPRTHTEYQVVNLDELANFKADSVVDIVALHNSGQIGSLRKPVKLLARGEMTAKLTIQLQAISATAKTAIEKAGGSVEVVGLPKIVTTTKDDA